MEIDEYLKAKEGIENVLRDAEITKELNEVLLKYVESKLAEQELPKGVSKGKKASK